MAENRLGLKALDHLSNASIVPSKKAIRRGGKATAPTLSNPPHIGGVEKRDHVALTETLAAEEDSNIKKSEVFASSQSKRRKRKNVTSIIVDQVGHFSCYKASTLIN